MGCQTQLIPNTDVEDTPENRALIDFCEKYRKAVEHRNIGYLLQIAHTDYYEDGGNADSTDDLDRAGLDKYLHERFAHLFEEWAQSFEFIVLDTPAMTPYSDGLAVASLAGRVLTLIRAQHTSYRDTREMFRRLDAARAEILGAVISHF